MIFLILSFFLVLIFFFVCLQPLFLTKQKKLSYYLQARDFEVIDKENRLAELSKDLLQKKISKQDFQVLRTKFLQNKK